MTAQPVAPDGDQGFEATVLPHARLLHRVATRMTGSPEEAKDLVQETLLRAFGAFEGLRPESRARPWLLKILQNTFISDWRRRKRERSLLQPALCADRAPWLVSSTTSPRPEDVLGDEVTRALEELPEPYRDCVLLVDLHQRSYKEAAQALGRPVGTVMSRLFRGRRLLQGKLDGYARQEGYISRAA